MSFVKESQSLLFEGTDVLTNAQDILDKNELRMPEDLIIEDPGFEELPEIEVDQDSPTEELILTLDRIPGGLDQDEISEPEDLAVEEEEDVVVDDNPWNCKEPKNLLSCLSKIMQSIPSHSGRDTAGIERAISYLERADKFISALIRMDIKNEVDIVRAEEARDEIRDGIARLEERHEQVEKAKYPKRKKNNKKASSDEDSILVKEAQKATSISGISINVSLFISTIARICINGMVSAGHDIEDMFDKLSKKYKLSDREKLELIQLLADMNYPVRRDRGFMLDEEIDTTKDGFDWAANYPA
jgi:hypothetical protein